MGCQSPFIAEAGTIQIKGKVFFGLIATFIGKFEFVSWCLEQTVLTRLCLSAVAVLRCLFPVEAERFSCQSEADLTLMSSLTVKHKAQLEEDIQ